MGNNTHDPHEHVDGCLCGTGHANDDQCAATCDNELPSATGGVQGDRTKPQRAARKGTRTGVEGDE